MRSSKDIAPHVTSFQDVEVSALMANRKKYKAMAADQDIHLTFLPYMVKAIVAVMKKFPDFDASIDGTTDEIIHKHYYNVGIATSTDHGLYVPNIKNADSKGMFEIAKEIADNTQAAKDNKLSADQMSGGSITISNVGSLVVAFTLLSINLKLLFWVLVRLLKNHMSMTMAKSKLATCLSCH